MGDRLPRRDDMDRAMSEDTTDAQVDACLRRVGRKMKLWRVPGAESWEREGAASAPVAELVMLEIRAAGYVADYYWHGTLARPVVQFAREETELLYPHGQDPGHRKWRPAPPVDMMSVFGGGELS